MSFDGKERVSRVLWIPGAYVCPGPAVTLLLGWKPPVDKGEFDDLNRWSQTGSLFGPRGFLFVCFKLSVNI